MKNRAFTLIELIMVMVIVSIMAAIAIPRFQSFYDIKLGGTARKLVADVRYAQQLAIINDEAYGVEFNTGAETYRIYRVSDNSTVIDPLTRGNFIMDYTTDAEYIGIDLDSVDFAGTSTLMFNAMGVPQDSGGNNIAAEGTVDLSYKGMTRTITVTPNTGRTILD